MSKTRFVLTEDDQGRLFYKVFGKDSSCVTSIGDKNIEYVGTPKLNIRTGDSKFGEEFFVEFHIKSKVNEYPANSNYDNLEIYFSIDDARRMFNDLFKFFERLKEEDKK